MHDQLASERTRHAVERDIVVRRTDATRGKHDIEAARAMTDFLGDQRDVVGYHRDTLECDANCAQLAGCEVRIGVLRLSRIGLHSPPPPWRTFADSSRCLRAPPAPLWSSYYHVQGVSEQLGGRRASCI